LGVFGSESQSMRSGDGGPGTILCGTREQAGGSRALAEFRSGRPLIITGGNETLLALPVEGLEQHRLAAFRALAAPTAPRLVLTNRRARSLGIEASGPVAIALSDDADAQSVLALVVENKPCFEFVPEPAGVAAAAAVDLVKLAQVLPAVLVAQTDPAISGAFDPCLITVDAKAVARFREEGMQSLVIAAEGQVPLASRVKARFVVFRDSFGDDPVAVIVGAPNLSVPVPVRIHSACLTGDVFGSRRCDCGDQLRLALARLHEAGGGIILYLAQEGRGVGLANKMRTYKLQDAGLDTVDANNALGFDDDERDYGVAVRMLQMLGATRVMLLTNNPNKLDSLTKAGIEVFGRMPLETPLTADNRRYLTAKAERAGHHLGHAIGVVRAAEVAQECGGACGLRAEGRATHGAGHDGG
jgi:GTP cyclohydrolase II